MSKQVRKFHAVETVKKPVRVKFELKSGKTIFIKAYKVVEKKTFNRSRTKKK
jgi:hypothetical protein